MVLYLTLISNGRWLAGGAAAVLAVGAVIVTHHISTYALIAFLVIWARRLAAVPITPADGSRAGLAGDHLDRRSARLVAARGPSDGRLPGRQVHRHAGPGRTAPW
ncbi:MAG: hypothetical protein WKF78_06500 [Candidatus Limnocylindrales bacterium]